MTLLSFDSYAAQTHITCIRLGVKLAQSVENWIFLGFYASFFLSLFPEEISHYYDNNNNNGLKAFAQTHVHRTYIHICHNCHIFCTPFNILPKFHVSCAVSLKWIKCYDIIFQNLLFSYKMTRNGRKHTRAACKYKSIDAYHIRVVMHKSIKIFGKMRFGWVDTQILDGVMF